MAYNRTNWSSNDLITAEKLNNLENGVANLNTFYITATITTITPSRGADENITRTTLSASYDDIIEAINNNKIVQMVEDLENAKVFYPLTAIGINSDYMAIFDDTSYSALQSTDNLFYDSSSTPLINA